MSQPDKNWMRWITASIYKVFNEGKGDYGILVEGAESKIGNNQSRAEIRINGLTVNEVSKGVFIVTCDVNVLISSVISRTDLYAYQTMTGHFFDLFPDEFCIYKLGVQAGDDQSRVTCLLANSELQVMNFGIIGPDINLQRGSLQMSYKSVEIEYGSD